MQVKMATGHARGSNVGLTISFFASREEEGGGEIGLKYKLGLVDSPCHNFIGPESPQTAPLLQ